MIIISQHKTRQDKRFSNRSKETLVKNEILCCFLLDRTLQAVNYSATEFCLQIEMKTFSKNRSTSFVDQRMKLEICYYFTFFSRVHRGWAITHHTDGSNGFISFHSRFVLQPVLFAAHIFGSSVFIAIDCRCIFASVWHKFIRFSFVAKHNWTRYV